MAGNSDWARDELILALDLYFEVDFPRESAGEDAEVRELSALLNSLPIRVDKHRSKTANDVAEKLSSFLRFDPTYRGTGVSRSTDQDEAVWNDFANRRDRLRLTAESIKKHAGTLPMRGSDLEDEEFAEGRLLTRIHLARERNATLVETKRRLVLKQTGKLECEACGFDFEEKYGAAGAGFAECHHTGPVAAPDAATNTRLADLAIVCANCHRMIHRLMRRSPQLHTPAHLKQFIRE